MSEQVAKKDIEKQIEILQGLGLEKARAALMAANKRLKDNEPRILVVGDYLRGKTTLLNALLGRELLCSGAVPVATTNRLLYAEHERAEVEHEGTMTTVDVSKIRDGDYRKVWVEGPWELCRQAQWIEHPSATEAADELLELAMESDLVLVVLAADALYSASEAAWVQQIQALGHRPIFVCNFLDRVPENQVSKIRQSAYTRLPADADRIHFIAALPALEGDASAQEGLDILQRSLLSTIAEAKAHIKAERVRALLESTNKMARERIAKLSGELAEQRRKTQERVSDLYDAYEAIETATRDIDADLQRFEETTRTRLRALVTDWLNNMAMEIADEIGQGAQPPPQDAFQAKIDAAVDRWRQQQLAPFFLQLDEDHKRLLDQAQQGFQRRLREFHTRINPEQTPTSYADTPDSLSVEDIDVSLRPPSVSPGASQESWGPELAVAAASIIVVFVLRSLLLGIVTGLIGLGVAAMLRRNRELQTDNERQRSAARSYAGYLRAQVDRIGLAVYDAIRPSLMAAHQRLKDWMTARQREAQTQLTAMALVPQGIDQTTLDEWRLQLEHLGKGVHS